MEFNGDVIAVMIVWTLFVIYAFLLFIFNTLVFPDIAKEVYSKDCDIMDPKTINYQYLITIFVDYIPSPFDKRKLNLFMDLITKDSSLMVSLCITSDDIVNGRASILYHRKRLFRPITKVRAIHNLRDYGINLRGISVTDHTIGHTIYYCIKHFIYLDEMVKTKIHPTIDPKLRFCSQQTFAPQFCINRSDNFSMDRLEPTPDMPTRGVILLSKLTLIEDLVFVNFFMIQLFFFNALSVIVLMKTTSDLNGIWIAFISTLMSSCLSFYATNICALFYRKAIKYSYDRMCSPQLKRNGNASIRWTLIANACLTYLFGVSIIVGILTPKFIDQSIASDQTLAQQLDIHLINDQLMNEALVMTLMFVMSVVLSLTLWLIIYGCIRYIYLTKISSVRYHPIKTTLKRMDDKSDTHILVHKLNSLNDEESEIKVPLSVEVVKKDIDDDDTNPLLNTGSTVIDDKSKATNAYKNPDNFRINSNPNNSPSYSSKSITTSN